MIDATPITQEIAEAISANVSVGTGCLFVYWFNDSICYLRDAIDGIEPDGMTDDEHYEDAYQRYSGSSFEYFESTYSRSKTY
jgi:hypothetical protein